jgi:hypothetical protein
MRSSVSGRDERSMSACRRTGVECRKRARPKTAKHRARAESSQRVRELSTGRSGVSTGSARLAAAMAALIESSRRGSRDLLLLAPDVLEQRIAADSCLVHEFEQALADTMQAGADVEMETIASLTKELRHALAVYRRVLLSGLRSSSALLRVTSAGGHEIGPGI